MICFSLVLIVGPALIAALFYDYGEDNFDFVDSVYLSIVTASTVGYGDISPTKDDG